MHYDERCQILNSNPVLVDKTLSVPDSSFSKEIVTGGPLGNTKFYAIPVEFQVIGSSKIHFFYGFWIHLI